MAKLKFTVDDVVELPGPLREFYAKGDDGKFHLDMDGDSPKLAEFRNSNRALNTAKTDLESQLAAAKAAHIEELTKIKVDGTKVAELESQLAAAKNAHAAMS